jgi:CheY-like chemotaxis protein
MNEPNVLILGDQPSHLAELADTVRELGFRAIRAKTPQDAIAQAQERGHHFGAALVDPELPALDLANAFSELRRECSSPNLVVLASGKRPSDAERERLREGGVKHALWLPVTDHALLFHLNNACYPEQPGTKRNELSAPVGWMARAMVAGRSKLTQVYALSAGGAYLLTDRPSLRGSELVLELPLPEGPMHLEAEVLYTNVPGNLRRNNLPTGMYVEFLSTPAADQETLQACIVESAADYLV